MSSVKDRLRTYIESKKMTVRDFERSAGLSNGYVGSIRKSIGPDSLDKIIEQHPEINRDWLLFGEGDMLVKSELDEEEEPLTPENAIRYYPSIPITASHLEDIPGPSYDDMQYQLMRISGWENCVAFPAVGDSMYPRISNGDTVVLREWTESYLSNGDIYLVITRNGDRTIKYLTHTSTDDEGKKHFTATSANPDQQRFAPFDIVGDDIVRLFVVLGCIKKFKM